VTAATPSLRANLRALPQPAWILFAGTFVNRFGSFVFVFLVLYLQRNGYSQAEAGAALGSYGVGALAAAVAGGHLADRVGRRNAIVVSMLGSAATVVALAQAGGLAVIVALVAAVGFFSELYRPAAGALLADLTPAGQRVTAFALYRFAINAGFAAGPITAGFVAEDSFAAVFYADAATSLAFALLALAALPAGRRSRRDEEERGELVRAIRRDRAFRLFLVSSTLAALVYFQQSSTFALHVRDAGLSTGDYGLLMSVNGIAIILVELPLTGLTQRLPARSVIATGMLLTGIGFALTGLVDTVALLAVTVLVWTLGEILAAPVASAYVADLAPAHLRGRYQGAWSFTWSVGLILGPTLGTTLYASSTAALWLACLAACAAAAGLVMLGPKRQVAPSLARPEAGPEVPGVET
jgi:MFS family permease